MRLLRFGEIGHEQPGVEIEGIKYDCSSDFKGWDRSFFVSDGLSRLQVKAASHAWPEIPDGTRIGSPIPRPGMIMCVGLNYSDHAQESGMHAPEEPILFMKASNTLAGPYDDVTKPTNSTKMDWEVELGVVLSKDVYMLKDEAGAEDAIAGYCIVNDLSERAFQIESGGQWVKGKSCPGFSPVGPYLVTKDEIESVLDLDMSLDIDGLRMQTGNTEKMIFSPSFVVHYISQFMKLEAGDLISTGTPPGVGLGMDPPRFLNRGEKMTLNIKGLGSQNQLVV